LTFLFFLGCSFNFNKLPTNAKQGGDNV